MEKKPIKVGILLDSWSVPAWAYEMLKRISDEDYATVTLLVVNDSTPSVHRRSIVEKLRKHWRSIGSKVATRLLGILQKRIVDRSSFNPDAFELRNLKSLFEGVDVLNVKPRRKVVSDYFESEDLESIQKHDVDVFIRLGFRILRGGILKSARYGVWSYHHGDNRVNRGGPAGFWETMEEWPETGTILQILTEDLDNGKVLYRSYSCTHKDSTIYNRNNFYWKTLSFIPRKLKELHRVGATEFFKRVDEENEYPEFYSERLYVQPGNFEHFVLILRKLKRKIWKKVTALFFFEQWILLFDIRGGTASSLWRYKRIKPPRDRFWADPHVILKDDRYFIFIEEYLYRKGVGHISLIEMDDKGNYTEPVVVLERPYHLSYPFVFKHDGDYYMIPESRANRTIELYRCTEFPGRWEFVRNLMEDLEAVDTTLHYRDGRWWMFTNIIENRGGSGCDELFLFSSEDFLKGDWLASLKNPVISDAKNARPAGKLFESNGRLYRPSQNCSVRYGYGFNLNEVIKLGEHEFEERMVSQVKPNWRSDVLGCHSFNRAGRLSVSDALVKRFKY